MVDKLHLEAGEVETRNGALAVANIKLIQDLALAETE
ncbi:hypothetical protein SOVF_180530 [Spinacia oleracea]|nr:hypothetical protein SOVF_180530 [Spinacia oleracea]